MIGYLGPVGTFSHLAATEYFGNNTEFKAYPSIQSLILAADSGEVTSAILPIENSIEGSVNMTLDTLVFKANLSITGEYVLKVHENLMTKEGVELKDVERILSHPQPIAQCSQLIEKTFLGVPVEFCESTAQAAQIVKASEKPYAVIGPKSLAAIYDLFIQMENCGDEPNNSTRFVIVEKQTALPDNADKTSIAFTLDDEPGSLYNAIELFARRNINMIKIESRPVKTELGKYVFFIDVDGNAADEPIRGALELLKTHTDMFKLLGTYKKA